MKSNTNAIAIPASQNRGERQDEADSIRPQNTSHGGEGCHTATFTRVEIRAGRGVTVTSVASEFRRDDYAGLHRKGVFAGTRRRIERFYDDIDRHLAAWEREMCPRKNRRRRHGKRRHGKFLSSHLLGDFRKSPRLYQKKMNGEIEPAESAALAVGRAVHTLVLEGRSKFDEEFLVTDGPVNPKTGEPFGKLTKAYKEWAAAQTKDVVGGPDFAFMSKLRESVWAHPVACELLDDGIAEQTVRTHYCDEPCQIRGEHQGIAVWQETCSYATWMYRPREIALPLAQEALDCTD